ncbi:hypothetical protein RN001_002847 [Aquatica leii]|uniref:Uncharacterized protein n=1 Tax=Aquatica leii TaxID=1421715 RepID=A0AAN7SDJ6_9COLE|nr:hypothetical protein RN001_002847 [Aquatica leii]
MSFGLPPIKVKPAPICNDFAIDNGSYGLQSLMTTGLATTHAGDSSHPLILSERNYHKNRHTMNMVMLRNTQGLHAPLKITMELKAAKQIGRLPFLSSSNVMHDSLTGRDLEIGPEDVFNTAEFREIEITVEDT